MLLVIINLGVHIEGGCQKKNLTDTCLQGYGENVA